jgi:hypothetical protein
VSSKLQVRLPVRLARRLRIQSGDLIYWRISDDLPGVLQLLPEEVVERRYSAGERLESAAQEAAQELRTEDRPVAGADDEGRNG